MCYKYKLNVDLSEYKDHEDIALELSRMRKIQSIVSNQLFSVVYDVAAQLLISDYNNYKTNTKIFDDMIIK